MDRKTANRLADEPISAEQTSPDKSHRRDDTPIRAEVGLGHFATPVLLSAALTWIALASGASGFLAVVIGASIGMGCSYLVLKRAAQ